MKLRPPADFTVLVQAIFCALTFISNSSRAAVGVTISPAIITNDFAGKISITVTGLTAGKTIRIEKFADPNTNGVVNAPENKFLWRSFLVTDGQLPLIGSCTNLNVAGDMDGATNTQIRAELFYPGVDLTVDRFAIKYLIRVSDPLNTFTPITNSFEVRQKVYPQGVTGKVVANGTGLPLTNAVVALARLHESGGYGAVADSGGNFTIYSQPGSYAFVAVYTNTFVTGQVTVSSNVFTSQNFTSTASPFTVSGKVSDSANGAGLPGILVTGQTSSVISVSFTDTNGNYSVPVSAGGWGIGPSQNALAQLGYVGLDSRVQTNVTGNISNFNFQLPKATALVYGQITDNLGNPLIAIDSFAEDASSFYYETGGQSYATNGAYCLGVIAGDWYVQPEKDTLAQAGYATPQGNSVTLTNGQCLRVNFTALRATNHITGNVQFQGTNVVGLGVNAGATIGGTSYQAHGQTDSSGNYSLIVGNGDWNVSVNCSSGDDSLNTLLGNGNFQCPINQNVTINNNNGTANFTILPLNTGQIFGWVTDNYGNPVTGVSVYANGDLGNYSTVTDGNGYFTFWVANGDWFISMACAQLNALGYQCADTNVVRVLDDSEEMDFIVLVIPPVFPLATLHSFSASDANANDVYTNRDGFSPYCGLVLSGGTLYGTASSGGTNGSGTVFAVGTSLTNYTVVHTFTAQATNASGLLTNSDGADVFAGLILSGATLYGTAFDGGSAGYGTVFKLNTNGTGFTVLHAFTGAKSNSFGYLTNSDGANPGSRLVLSGGTLYGTALNGGTNGSGTVFAVTTNGTVFTVVHSFTKGSTNVDGIYTNSEGANPIAGLVLSGSTLFGAAGNGGTNGSGTLFSVNTNSTAFTILHPFNDNDGVTPFGDLLLSSNTLYGTAAFLGNGGSGSGTVFAMNTNGTGFTVLHTFTGSDDGANPYAGLMLSGTNLYGTATGGGSAGSGTVFAVGTNGRRFTVLHTFTGDNDGANPEGSLILSGNFLYGTTVAGGIDFNGTVFALSVTPAPVISAPVHLVNGPFQMTVNGSAGQNYTVQMSTNLSSTNWSPLLITNPASGTFLFSDPGATNKQRFYRVLLGP